MQREILDVIERSGAIPAMPQIVTRLIELTRDANYGIGEVVSVLSSDPGIASDVLRLANSPLFGVTRKISSLQQAINLLGIKRIRTLVMGRCMVSRVQVSGRRAVDLGYYWRRSLATGVLSARFADQVAPSLREEAFIGGLLCDLGVVVLSTALGERYAPPAALYAPKGEGDFLACEKRAVGVTHPEVSAVVLERWTLPEVIVGAARHHHDVSGIAQLPKGAAEVARVVHAGSEIARLLCEAPSGDVAAVCEAALGVAGLGLEALESALVVVEADVSELATLLKVELIPSEVYALIAESIHESLAVAKV